MMASLSGVRVCADFPDSCNARLACKGDQMFDFLLGLAFVVMIVAPALIATLRKTDSDSGPKSDDK